MPFEWLIDLIKEWVIAQAYATEAWVLGKDYQSGADVPEWTNPISVSGILDPDSTCTYLKAGTYNNQPYYRRLDGSYFIWWDGTDQWYITKVLGHTPPLRWQRIDPSILGDYTPGPGSTGTATVSVGYNYLKTGFIDRGDPAAVDFAYGDLTHDGAWRDLDLSGIVPAGAKAVSLFHRQNTGTVLKHIYFRTKGNVNDKNVSKTFQQVANILRGKDHTIPLDADRKIQYESNIPIFSTCNITVKGWWF